MAYQIYETETFSRLYDAMEKEEQQWLNNIKKQLKENPHVGKPLRFSWFREKKFGNKRIYYLVYQNLNRILLVSFGSKKINKRL